MSDVTFNGASDLASDALHEPHPAATVFENLDERLGQLSLQEIGSLASPVNLPYLPPEVLLEVLKWLEKRDWLSLARSCRRLSHISVPELDKYSMEKGKNHRYALWYACVANKPDVLLRQIALDPKVIHGYFTRHFAHKILTCAFGRNMTPLAVAIAVGNGAIVKLLLAHGADPNRLDRCPVLDNQVLYHPINWAATSPHESSVPIIRMLRDYSADMDQLPKAVTGGASARTRDVRCAPIFRILTLEKPLLHPSRQMWTTNCEMYNNDLQALQGLRLRQLATLLACGADPDQRYGGDGETPIFFLLANLAHYTPSFYFSDRLILSHEADAQADLINEIVVSFLDTLCQFGANLELLGNMYCPSDAAHARYAVHPETPLHAACRLNDRHKPIIRWFLDHGVSINSLDGARRTPLMVYCRSRFTNLDQFRWFLSCGPIINDQDMQGHTALHELCDNEELRPQVKEKAVRMLLNQGADPTLLNVAGHAPGHKIYTLSMIGGRLPRDRDVLLMLRDATKKREAWRREWEKRKQENKAMDINTRSDTREDDDGSEHGSGQAKNHVGHRANRPGSNRNRRGSARTYRGNHRKSDRGGHRGGHHGNQDDRSRDQLSQNPGNSRTGGMRQKER
jgi:ankyrin repeat protein